MSKGTKIYAVRLSEALVKQVTDFLSRRSRKRISFRDNMSDFIRQAIREKLAHSERSRKTKKEKEYPCLRCGAFFPLDQLPYQYTSLDGVKHYKCKTCVACYTD